MDLNALADRVITGQGITADEALDVLRLPDERTYELVAAAGRVRRHFHGASMKVNYLVNLKSGKCPEDCFYCSQRLGSAADILRYTWLTHDDALAAAQAGIKAGAKRVCLVASGRGPTDRDVDRVGRIITSLKDDNPDVEVCACLGILKDGQAVKAADDRVGNAVGLGAEVLSEIGGFELVVLHHRQVIVQKIVVAS